MNQLEPMSGKEKTRISRRVNGKEIVLFKGSDKALEIWSARAGATMNDYVETHSPPKEEQ